MIFKKFIHIKLILLNLLTSLALADDCSVIKDILTQNSLEITWSPSNSTGCCSYEGISCVDNRIVQINFSSKGFSGNIESLMPLTSLQYININNCGFSGPIPSSIESVSNLQFFYAKGNKISGSIPKELAISTLQFIDLSDNKLEGQIPDSLGKVLNLQHINLRNNNLQGSIPSSFHSLKNIQVLNVSGNSKLCGEIPVLSNTLKDCNFDSTSLCINDSRTHCTNKIKTCDTVSCNGEINASPNNNNSNSLGSDDSSNKPNSKSSNIGKWIAIGFVILLIILIIILVLICSKRGSKNSVVIDKPIPSHSSEVIFTSAYEDINTINTNDPDASIQIQSLNISQPNPQPQHILVPNENDLYGSQTSSFEESSQYESLSGRSSNYENINKNYTVTLGRSPINNAAFVKPGSVYTTNSLNRSQVHLANPGMIGTVIESTEQDLGDIIISNNNSPIMNENMYTVATTSMGTPAKRLSNVTGYSKSQSSPNLVRLNRYSVVNQNSPQAGLGKRRLTTISIDGSPKLVPTPINSSPTIDSKHFKHYSTPYPVSPFGLKSVTVSNHLRKASDTKRKSSTGNENVIYSHNTVHVASSKKSIPYPFEKSSTSIANGNNYSETFSSSSAHSTTPILTKNKKNRNSLPSDFNGQKQYHLSKFSSQNSMNASPLAINSGDNSGENPWPSDHGEINLNENKRNSVNPSVVSSNITVSTIQNIANKVSNESLPNKFHKHNTLNINTNYHAFTDQEHSYNLSTSSEDESNRKDSHNPINNISDTNLSYNQSSLSLKNIQISQGNDSNIIHTSNTTPLENSENPTEEIYLDDDDDDFSQVKLESINGDEDNKEYRRMMLESGVYQEYNTQDNITGSFEEQQPPNYEEVFSEMYSPYIDASNDETIRMQLEMRRIEERQLRMEYLQKQIDNPELSSTQRQKYIDALDRLMLE
ncbi:hypothetical protein LY90DRAFT_507431 [Neocallimastix californiae]|jgi:hypothetical protein|uniref:L domain-like protein n=1 Tax=Neocallimastix californiae TaxID=1754190 RepID=A0A1Y2D5R3_9FUNG|nr:hypothetical protein LY90DRAFT_507431 [Neocallimastix californiae]|eukprot:ORY54621.1 hypothetical protein LY90DRAFT_507431 [Neocallimastix californiae]